MSCPVKNVDTLSPTKTSLIGDPSESNLVPSPLMEGRWIHSITGVNRPSGVALANTGDIIITETESHRIKMVTRDGNTIMSIVSPHILHPCGVAVYNDLILVVDSQGQQLHSLTLDGCRDTVFANQSGGCHLEWPTDITVGFNDKIYITDRNSHRIHVLNSDMRFLFSFGNKGISLGQFKFPSGITSDTNGIVYIADSLNHRIQKFSYNGDCLASFGQYGCLEGYLNQPTAICIDNNGIIYVAELGNHRISMFSDDGQFLCCCSEWGVLKGQLRSPCGLAVDCQSRLYICDHSNNRVQIF